MSEEVAVHEGDVPRRGGVRIGVLRDRIRCDDDTFDWPDPEIATMFYGRVLDVDATA